MTKTRVGNAKISCCTLQASVKRTRPHKANYLQAAGVGCVVPRAAEYRHSFAGRCVCVLACGRISKFVIAAARRPRTASRRAGPRGGTRQSRGRRGRFRPRAARRRQPARAARCARRAARRRARLRAGRRRRSVAAAWFVRVVKTS